MRLGAIPQNFKESIALAAGLVPTPLIDTLVALLLAKTIMAATAVGIFQALEGEPLTSDEIAKRCGSDPQGTTKLVWALFACRYLKYRGSRFTLAPVARRWLLRGSLHSLHSAILHRNLDLRFMNFEEYVGHGKCQDFHSGLSPEDWQVYHYGQADHAAQMIDEVIDRIPLPPNTSDLLDLGGGHGLYSIAFCRRYRNLRARVLDLAITTGESAQWVSDDAYDRVKFEVGDIRTVALQRCSTDVILLANVLHHFDESTNCDLMRRVASALRPGGIVIVIDAFRCSSVEKMNQLEGLLDLYFGAASGVGLWTIAKVQEWTRNAGLIVLQPTSVRRMPLCKMQVARKAPQIP